MKLVRYRLKPESPLGTPLQSDTLAGHLLCYLREREGDAALEEALEKFEAGDPPFIVSSAFPSGMLPRPEMPPMGREALKALVRDKKSRALFGKEGETTFKSCLADAIKDYKDFKKAPFIDVPAWKNHKQGVSEGALFLAYLKKTRGNGEAAGNMGKAVTTSHNTINRNTMTVAAEGGLYFTETTFFGVGTSFDLYARVQPGFQETFDRLLQEFSLQGFGRDRSSGKGFFAIENDASFNPDSLELSDGNAFLSLSLFSATDMGSWDGNYRLMTKYGRVWNGFGENNPFKKPTLAFREGAVFRKKDIDYSRSVLKEIHSNPGIVQCVLPLFISFQWEAS